MDRCGPPEAPDPAEIAGIERREHTRHTVHCPAICSAEGSAACEAVVVDASNGGFGLNGLRLAVAIDDVLHVELNQIGVFRCRVAWKRGERCGVEILDDESPTSAEMEALARGISKRPSSKTP